MSSMMESQKRNWDNWTRSSQNAHNMKLTISPQELDETIKSLQSDKAERQDGITNKMLKNTGV